MHHRSNTDLDFASIAAAGLQERGFDPNNVVNDPSLRRRDSPRGSKESLGTNRAPFAETVSDAQIAAQGPVVELNLQDATLSNGGIRTGARQSALKSPNAPKEKIRKTGNLGRPGQSRVYSST